MAITPPDPNATEPRYTTLLDVKAVLGIAATNTEQDARITEAIVAGEVSIDLHMDRSLPDTDETEDPAVITIVPSAWKQVALEVAVGVYKAAEAPFGSAGSDDWLGVISVPEIVRSAVDRSPLLVGYQTGFRQPPTM